MGFLLQITMSCPCALSRQVAGAGAGCRCWCCELAVHVVETGCWCRCRRWAGAVSWLCTWWRHAGAGAGCRCWCWAGAGCRVQVLVVAGAVRVLVLGAGCRCWRCWCWVPGAGAGRVPVPVMVLWAGRVVETGCWCRCWCWVPVLVLSRAVLFARILLYVHCSMRNARLSTDHCFSMFQPATHKIVVLDTAWPWVSEAYGLCRLCALLCTHKLIRARSYGLMVPQIVASSVLQRQ